MKKQPTVLLVSGDFVPPLVGQHLRARGVHVEICSLIGLELLLSAIQVDLLILGLEPMAQANDKDLVRVLEVADLHDRKVPLVALADWSLCSPPSARARVDAVVPNDLPEAAIAHRLHTLVNRSVNGEPLENKVKRLPPVAASEAPPFDVRPGPSQPPRSAPMKRSAGTLRSEPFEPVAAQLGGPFERPVSVPSPLASSSKKADQKLSRDEEPIGDREERAPTPEVDSAVGAGREEETVKLVQPAPQEPLAESFDLEVTKQVLAATLVPPAPEEQSPNPAPKTPSDPPRLRVGTSPSSIRVPLSSPLDVPHGARIALIDDDLTRADALATTLRARRVQVFPLSSDLDRLRPRLLRKFAPHALLVDEQALKGSAAELVSWIREDPFLYHAQLLVARLPRLYRSQSGATQIESFLPHLEPLAVAEMSLLEKLGPTCEVEFGLDEVPPHLLLKLLVPRNVSTQIECTHDHKILTWTVGWSRAADAELRDNGKNSTLQPREAFEWLLDHPTADAVVLQRPETQELQGSPILPFVDERIAEVPGLGSESGVERGPRSVSSRPPDSLNALVLEEKADPSSSSGRALGIGLGALAAAAAVALVFVNVRSQPQAVLEPSASQAVPEIAPRIEGEESSHKRTTHEEEVVESEATKPGVDPLFVVSPDSGMKTCSELLEGWTPLPGQQEVTGRFYYGRALKSLRDGDQERAHLQLCESAFVHPTGKGGRELVRLYLEGRSLNRAEATLQPLLAVERWADKALLLRGDLLSQRGHVEEALSDWLTALHLRAAESGKRRFVAKKYLRDAKLASKHANYALAERYIRRAVTLDSGSESGAHAFAEVLQNQGLGDASARWVRRVATLRRASE